ncbi:MAG: hypothetical protein WC462_00300 [archaeon]
MISVLNNAYFRKAQEHPNFSLTHQKILFFLLYDKKYYSKHELLYLTNHNQTQLEKIIKELEQTGTIKTEGWLVKACEQEILHKQLCPELILSENPKINTSKTKNL